MGPDRNPIAHGDERWGNVRWGRSRSEGRSCEGRRRERRRESGVVKREAPRRPKGVFHRFEGRPAKVTSQTGLPVRKRATRTWSSPTARKERRRPRRDRNGLPPGKVPVRGRRQKRPARRKRNDTRLARRRPRRRRGRPHRSRARFPPVRRLPAGRRQERQPMRRPEPFENASHQRLLFQRDHKSYQPFRVVRRMQFIGVRSREHSGNCKLPRTRTATEIPSWGQPDRGRGTSAFRRKA
jgi:hypothetical protein